MKKKRSICDAIFSAIQDDIRNLCDTEIFTQSTFMELGEFFYGKLINSVEGATVDLINTVVSVLNKNSNQAEQNEYYENLCQVLSFDVLKKAFAATCMKRETSFGEEEVRETLDKIKDDSGLEEMWNRFKRANYFVDDLSWGEVSETIVDNIEKISFFSDQVS